MKDTMKATFLFLCRLVPALVFLFSGFIKAIDPFGGMVKFEDYFTAFGWSFFHPLALPLSIALAVFEFSLGFFLLFKLYMRWTATAALAMMGLFTLLTFYIALFNPVSDCGCFGDAIKLSNWATFFKNVVVIAFAGGAWYFRKHYTTSSKPLKQVVLATLAVVYVLSLALYSHRNLPVLDFRPYAIGTNIPDKMRVPDGAAQPEYETIFTLEKEGVRATFGVDDYPYEDTTWVFVDSETRTISEGYVPPLQTFALMDPGTGDNLTAEVLSRPGAQFFLISPRLSGIKEDQVLQLAEMAERARQNQQAFYFVTASGSEEMRAFDEKHSTLFSYLHADETTLKTIIRSNPGLLLIYDGTIAGKWHYRKLPPAKITDQPLAYALDEQRKSRQRRFMWLHALGILMLPIIIKNIKPINN